MPRSCQVRRSPSRPCIFSIIEAPKPAAESTDNPATTFSYGAQGDVPGTETVEVPAGTFDTLEVRITTEYGSTSTFMDRVVGAVQTEQAELISY